MPQNSNHCKHHIPQVGAKQEIFKQLCACLCRNSPAQYSTSEWNNIAKEAVRHQLASLLYYRLKSTKAAMIVPSAILQQLHHAHLFAIAKNTYFSTMLSVILQAFQQEHIKVIVLKGAFLEHIVYGNMGLRMMSDVDLLVKKEELAHSQKILQHLGYFDSSYQQIDMHWNIDLSSAELQIEADELWSRTQPVVIAGVKAQGLSPEDVLLHLCMHQTFHHAFQFSPLRTLWDIREVIEHYSHCIHWEQLQCTAKQWGISRVVSVTLSFAHDMIEAPIPARVLDTMHSEQITPRIHTWVLQQMMSEPLEATAYSPYFWQIFAPGSFREKLKSLTHLIIPPAEFVSQKYPAPFKSLRNYFYYLIRLQGHVRHYLNALWRIVRRDPAMQALLKQQRCNIEMRKLLLSGKE